MSGKTKIVRFKHLDILKGSADVRTEASYGSELVETNYPGGGFYAAEEGIKL